MDIDEGYICDPIPAIREFVKLYDKTRGAWRYNEDCIARLEAEMQDILHEIELNDKLPDETVRALTERIHCIRKERRACKDENAQIKPFLDWSMNNLPTRNELAAVQGRIAQIKEKQQQGTYVPRVRLQE